jgi:hypothetical protein
VFSLHVEFGTENGEEMSSLQLHWIEQILHELGCRLGRPYWPGFPGKATQGFVEWGSTLEHYKDDRLLAKLEVQYLPQLLSCTTMTN